MVMLTMTWSSKTQDLMPDHKVVQVDTRETLGGGNIHCITQQQPEA